MTYNFKHQMTYLLDQLAGKDGIRVLGSVNSAGSHHYLDNSNKLQTKSDGVNMLIIYNAETVSNG